MITFNFRKALAVCGAICMMASCSEIMELENIPGTFEEFPIAASVQATKTLNDGGNISWVEGDEMTVIYTKVNGQYGNSTYTRVEGDMFSGEMEDPSDPIALYAVYPKSENVTTPVNVSYTIPSVQAQTGNNSQAHIAGANLPLYGSKTNVSKAEVMPVIPMRHVAAVIDFHITNETTSAITVKQVKFTSPYDMVGEFSTSLISTSLEWTAKNAGKTVTLDVSEGDVISAGESAEFFATVLPFKGAGVYGFEVLAADADGKLIVSEQTKTKEEVYEFPAGTCTTINYTFTKTGDATVPAYVKVTAEPESWDGIYLVVDEAASQAFAIGESGNKVSVTIDGDKVLANESLAPYALTVSDANVKHANNTSFEAYNVLNAAGKYIYYSSETIQIDDDNQKENSHDGNTYSYYHTFRYNAGGVEMMSSGHSSSFNKYYLGYNSNAFNYTNSASNRVQLYKLSDVTPSPIPYDPEVPATAKTYTKTNKIEAGKAYIIVSSGNALKNASGSPAAYSVSGKISGVTLTIPAEDVNSVEWTTAVASSDYRSKGDFSFTNNGVMITRIGSGDDDIKFDNNASTRSYWSLDNEGDDLSQKNSSGSITLYMQYTSSKWTAESQSPTNSIGVYVADPSSPVPPTPDDEEEEPTPSATTFNLENDYLSKYLTAADINYTNSTTKSLVSEYSGYSSSYDLPKPVSLSWTGNATDIKIYEGTSTSGTPFKTQSFTSSSSADIYNLIPGKTYQYVTSNGQTGTFNTTGRRRMIKISDNPSRDHARNCRDLGGIKTRNGESLKYGLMYRGTNMDGTTDAEKNILLNELGIKLDQDLRGDKTSSPLGTGVVFSNNKYDAKTIQNQNGENMKKTVSDVLYSVINGDPVYIHCFIGSDRTGHMCMLYEALLGCDLKECDIDYEITSFASSMVMGLRTIGSGNESSFRNKFVKSPYNVDSVPEAVEDYVVNTLKIDKSTIQSFREAMGVSKTLN